MPYQITYRQDGKDILRDTDSDLDRLAVYFCRVCLCDRLPPTHSPRMIARYVRGAFHAGKPQRFTAGTNGLMYSIEYTQE